jgi:phenylalanyl-tRNA synthetase beta chain
VGVTGALSGGWVSGSRGANLFDLKGALEKLVSAFGLKGLEMRETSDGTFSGSARAAVEIAGTALGVIGEIAPAVAKNFDIKTKVYILELDCEELMRLSAAGKRFIEPARYPPVLRDVSLIADNGVTNLRITDAICAGAGPLLKNVELIDRYRGGQIPDGKQSLTYRLEYRANDRTLEEKEVQDVHARVLRSLKENLGVTLR